MSAPALRKMLQEMQVIICCGAGGVGKTTTSAALAFAAARLGRRVLVLTIDPSRRLAETLDVDQLLPEPIALPEQVQARAGIKAPGHLSAWVLDPGVVSDKVVRELLESREEQERILENRIYRSVTRMIAGMQEYTAVEAVHNLVSTGKYDLIILDTPPSRNALNFLDAPTRLNNFLDGRIFKLFLPKDEGVVAGFTTKLIDRVLTSVFGEEFHNDFKVFLAITASLMRTLGTSAKTLRSRLRRSDVTFLLVTSPSEESRLDAAHFKNHIHKLELPFGGFILNRSLANQVEVRRPGVDLLPEAPTLAHQSALDKLLVLAEREQRLVDLNQEILEELRQRAGETAMAYALPDIPGGVDDVDSLSSLVELLLSDQDEGAA